MDIEGIKKDFPQFEANKELVYLDTAATSLTPTVVIDAVNEYYKTYRASVHRGLYKEAEKATTAYEDARKAVEKFIGAREGEVMFCSGATMASNIAMLALEESSQFHPGDEIITTTMEHHALLLPIQRLAKRKEMKVHHIPFDGNYLLDEHELKKRIHANTKIVAVTLASNVLGAKTDVRSIADIAHTAGAIVVVDGTAGVGHMPVDVHALGADIMFFSGHKMCGPTGVGVLFVKRSILEKLQPAILGGGIVEDVTLERATWTEAPQRFEAGTQHIAGVIALKSAVSFIEHAGLGEIETHCQKLVRYAIEKLKEIGGVSVYTAKPENNIGIVSFTVEGVHPHDVAQIAGKRNVAVRAGHHCALPLHKALGVNSTTRASFYMYNTESDVDALVDAIQEAKITFQK